MYAGLLSLLEHHLKTEVRTRLFLHYVCAASFQLELISGLITCPSKLTFLPETRY
jgi:hypothetical protein